jgi:galactokinase
VPTAKAPGRVTIIGDHTDYNGGLSLTMAIDLATQATYTPDPGSFLISLSSDQFAVPWEISLGGTAPSHPQAVLAAGLIRRLRPTSGGTIAVTSTLPMGAGLSSSAAFSVALLLALGDTSDPLALAKRCQEAEADTGAHVGLLDPLAIAGAQAGHALAIDFATNSMHPVRIPDTAAFVIVHSGETRVLGTSPYATRRAECDTAAKYLEGPLGLCQLADLSALPTQILRRRARHVVTECARVKEIERLLARGNLVRTGQLMTEGHRSLTEDFRVSTPAVDQLVAHLVRQPGVYGARMTGGGFGGCVIALCAPDSPALEPEAHAPLRAWRVSPSPGAALLAT